LALWRHIQHYCAGGAAPARPADYLSSDLHSLAGMERTTGPPDGVRATDLSILCDFDGTITLIDTAEYILDRFASGDWRGVERLLEAGDITIEECMKRQFEMITMSRESMIRELDGVVKPRPGFQALLELGRAGGHRFRITSAGLDFYIRHFLTARGWACSTEVVAPRVTDSGPGVRFEFPPKKNAWAHNFKEDNVLEERAAGRLVAYIGDGTSDHWAAMAADWAFAVQGSKLDRSLERDAKGHHAFTDFHQVIEVLRGR
jgi:2-hydroxy-3-keto-5-methylthiopentenyl-1-phosphate phosphatase